MVLMVPGTEFEDDLASVGGAEPKAELDAEELSANLPKEQQKVELDLEDAPFLEEEDDEEEEEAPAEEAVPLEAPKPSDSGDEPWYKRRKIVIPAGAGLLVLIALLVWFLTRPAKAPTPGPEPQEQAEEQTQEGQDVPPPPPAEEQEVQEFMVTLAPFWVEQREGDGKVRFLVCQFTTVTENEKLSYEISQKTTILRDAVFYYLKNKDLTYLSDKTNVEALKADLLSVMNQYLSVDRLETILVDQYLVK